MFKGIVQFIKSKTFFINLALFIVVFSLICWGIMRWLAASTNHGETVAVPDFTGVKLAQLDQFVADKHVRYQIIDSLYDPKAAKGVVVRQEPEPKALVKDNRTIYLYVTSLLPPGVLMPKLIDRSLRQATAMITSYGLKLGKITHTPNECSNCVLDQLVKGRPIAPGKMIPKGTVIDLVIGQEAGREEVSVPCLYGLTRKDAELRLQAIALTLGNVQYDNVKDSLVSKVYDQTPGCEQTKVKVGTVVDLFLTTTKSKIPNPDDLKKKVNDEDFDQ
jgi:beta-lactam-binding protein with PASTA domain